jgi:hypothetical protein
MRYMSRVTPGYAPSWVQPTYQQGMSNLSWPNAATGAWTIAAPASSSSGGGLLSSARWFSLASATDVYLSQQMGELTIQVTGVVSLNTHMPSSQDWRDRLVRGSTPCSRGGNSRWRSKGLSTCTWGTTPMNSSDPQSSLGEDPPLRGNLYLRLFLGHAC